MPLARISRITGKTFAEKRFALSFLAAAVGTDLIGVREWPGEYRLQGRVTSDLAPDVANNAPKADATHWTGAAMAEAVGISVSSVQRHSRASNNFDLN
jgi:hypothetical protein